MHNNMIIKHNLSILGGFYNNVGILLGDYLTCEELVGVTWGLSDCEELVGGYLESCLTVKN